MKNWKNIFTKKKKGEDDEEEILFGGKQAGLDASSLQGLTQEELVKVVLQYDTEVRKLKNKESSKE